MNTIEMSIDQPVRSASMPVGKVVVGIAIMVALLGFPLIAPGYQTFQLTGVMTYAVAALGLNLITGYVGQVSLGHNAFFALGSYTAVLANLYLGTGSFISVMLAGFVTFVAGVLAGYPAKRLRGLYLALITLILAVSVVPMIKQFKAYTGGAAGLLVDKPMPPAWFTLGQDTWIYYIVLAFTIVAFWLIRNFVGGSVGRALAGVREGDLAASSMGVNVNNLKVIVFGIGSMLAGIGGALATFTIGFIGPDSFTMMLSIGFLAAIVVGGLGTIWGALVAGLFLQYVPSYASDLGQALAGAVYGGILIVCMFLMPKGIVGSLLQFAHHRREGKRTTAVGTGRAAR
ncbi:branched-chain amino acid ABC transporter permease [Tardiphaga sp.]|jgi:branched-chain amino acid transport system permease protein|uniref:branched-chain amino acid ABC transporter permease n=1 Tax=Tardiphaga sp. TaxID=1926292 RepID=UPI0037D9CB6D